MLRIPNRGNTPFKDSAPFLQQSFIGPSVCKRLSLVPPSARDFHWSLRLQHTFIGPSVCKRLSLVPPSATYFHWSPRLVPQSATDFHWSLSLQQSFTGLWVCNRLSLVPPSATYFHWSLRLQQTFTGPSVCRKSPFLCATCSTFVFLPVTAQHSPSLVFLPYS